MKIILFLAGCVALMAQGPVPRPAPELRIGAQMLSNWRGHVVLLAFISTECPHCQRASGVFEQLSREFPRLEVTEVAFNENADAPAFAKHFGLSFPVVTGTSDQVHDFLGITRGARLGTPQVVAIDKAGVIRAQSQRQGSPVLQVHDVLYGLLKAMEAR